MEDLDNDGWPDLLLFTGNVYPDTERDMPSYPYHTPPIAVPQPGWNLRAVHDRGRTGNGGGARFARRRLRRLR